MRAVSIEELMKATGKTRGELEQILASLQEKGMIISDKQVEDNLYQ